MQFTLFQASFLHKDTLFQASFSASLTYKICKTNNYRYICTVINSVYNHAEFG